MKKLLALLLAFAMVFCLAACKSNDDEKDDKKGDKKESTEEKYLKELEDLCDDIITAYEDEDWESLTELSEELEALQEESEDIYEDLKEDDRDAAKDFQAEVDDLIENLYDEIPDLDTYMANAEVFVRRDAFLADLEALCDEIVQACEDDDLEAAESLLTEIDDMESDYEDILAELEDIDEDLAIEFDDAITALSDELYEALIEYEGSQAANQAQADADNLLAEVEYLCDEIITTYEDGDFDAALAAFEELEYLMEDAESIYDALYEVDPDAADMFVEDIDVLLTDAYDVLLYIDADSNFVDESIDPQQKADIFLAELEDVCIGIVDAYYSEDWETMESLGYDLEYLGEEVETVYNDLAAEDPNAALEFEENVFLLLEMLYEEIPDLSNY